MVNEEQSFPPVIIRDFIAVKGHPVHGNSYEGKHVIEDDLHLRFYRFSPLSSWWETRPHAGRHEEEKRQEKELRVLHFDP